MNVIHSNAFHSNVIANGNSADGERGGNQIHQIFGRFREILFEQVLPLWSTVGADYARGGYAETLSILGKGSSGVRRVRVSARQVYVVCEAADLGWNRVAAAACARHGYRFLVANTSAEGFLFHTLGSDDMVLDAGFDLYDQAFLLFAYAHAWRLLRDADIAVRARQLHKSIVERFGHGAGGYVDRLDRPYPLRANPHMHLLEAALAWTSIDPDPRWREFADELVDLCKARFVEPARGPVLETFDPQWRAIDQEGLHRVEPGHNYEWAWLLMRWERLTGGDAGAFPTRMIEFAETHGYDPARGVAMNEVWSDGSVSDSTARLWPQTERLKAWLAVAQLTHGHENWLAEQRAIDAASALMGYLESPSGGLWRDVMLQDGSFAAGEAPASSLYHIICAIGELSRYIDAGKSAASAA